MNKDVNSLPFYKLQASGNDFILIDNQKLTFKTTQLKKIARVICRRRFGAGGDGLLVIEPSSKRDFKMRIFNPDGTEAEMCGNGARCAALWAGLELKTKDKNLSFETKAGVIRAQVSAKKTSVQVKIKMNTPSRLKLNIPVKVLGRTIKVNYINTGVPHTVIFVEGLDKIDVESLGRTIRFHKKFKPEGTNVDFVEVLAKDYIKIRTYERGVEAETLACGTGIAAGAIITSCRLGVNSCQLTVKVLTKSGEVLKVYLNKKEDCVENVWLEGKACLVYKGEFLTREVRDV
ncbi:MAG TPA: diaminopimelate epimerase [Candidatus Omnitrophica bacterium]|nr:MAG: diaminopimelate epimerase [Candidatus Omnitrophota bacterium]RKY35404.1 MAG: diaminopimelate epimerase [Candidatus Omnitrophota bacterium]HEC69331.1 diaminopimelate epimerase [Candidatus Omnitrophota bacterium]